MPCLRIDKFVGIRGGVQIGHQRFFRNRAAVVRSAVTDVLVARLVGDAVEHFFPVFQDHVPGVVGGVGEVIFVRRHVILDGQ